MSRVMPVKDIRVTNDFFNLNTFNKDIFLCEIVRVKQKRVYLIQ